MHDAPRFVHNQEETCWGLARDLIGSRSLKISLEIQNKQFYKNI